MPPNDKMLTAKPLLVTRFAYDGTSSAFERAVPIEMPVNIVIAPVPYAVMMLTPQDLEDFAMGFSLTEGIIDKAEDIRDIRVQSSQGGISVEMTLASDKLQRHLARKRSLSGRTGCGVCGIEDIASLPLARVAQTRRVHLSLSAVQHALKVLPALQVLNQQTRAVHAAAWSDLAGNLLLIREDVGRHNALDKLVGALVRRGIDPASGFVVITSRCSFEMVEKVAAFGASAVVAVSAPTSLAIDRAIQHDILMLAIARDDSALCFSHPERLKAIGGAIHE